MTKEKQKEIQKSSSRLKKNTNQRETEKRLKMGDFFIEDILSKGKLLYDAAK